MAKHIQIFLLLGCFVSVFSRPQVGMPYQFSYEVNDPQQFLEFGHREASNGIETQGQYDVLLPDTRRQIVTYRVVGDEGYLANVRYTGNAVFPAAGSTNKNVNFNDPYNAQHGQALPGSSGYNSNTAAGSASYGTSGPASSASYGSSGAGVGSPTSFGSNNAGVHGPTSFGPGSPPAAVPAGFGASAPAPPTSYASNIPAAGYDNNISNVGNSYNAPTNTAHQGYVKPIDTASIFKFSPQETHSYD